MLPINIWAVILAAIAAFVLGFLFHGPISGKLWMKLANVHPTGDEKFSDMTGQMLWNLVANFFTALGLAIVYIFAASSSYLYGPGILTGIISGLIVWGGFLVTSSSIEVIWMKRSVKLWFFEITCSFIVMATMGAIIGSM